MQYLVRIGRLELPHYLISRHHLRVVCLPFHHIRMNCWASWLIGYFPCSTRLSYLATLWREWDLNPRPRAYNAITLLNRPNSLEDHVGIEPTTPFGSGFADQRVYHSANDPSSWSGWWGSNPRSLRSGRSTFAN